MGVFPQGGDGNSGEEGLEAGAKRLVSRIERRLTPQRRLNEESRESPGLESLQGRREFTDLPYKGPGHWDAGGLSLKLMGKARFAMQEAGGKSCPEKKKCSVEAS